MVDEPFVPFRYGAPHIEPPAVLARARVELVPILYSPGVLPHTDTFDRDTDQAAQRLRQSNFTLAVASIRFARPEIDRPDHAVPEHDRHLDDMAHVVHTHDARLER